MDSERIIVIRSDRCTQSTGESSAEFVFPKPMTIEPNEDAYIQLMRVSFAHSFYLINSFHDTLIVSGTTYTLTHGSYNAATMLKHLQALLPVTVAYNPARFRFTFSSTSSFQIGSSSTVLKILGIKTTQCDVDTSTFESGAVADLHGNHLIKVITNFDVDSLDSSIGRDSHLLAMIPVSEDMHTASTFAYEHYRPNTKHKALIHDRVISEVKISLLDMENHPINFNCIPFSVKLGITVVKRSDKYLSLYSNNASQAGTPHDEAADEVGDESEYAQSDAGQPKTRRPDRRRKRKRAPKAKGVATRKRK